METFFFLSCDYSDIRTLDNVIVPFKCRIYVIQLVKLFGFALLG